MQEEKQEILLQIKWLFWGILVCGFIGAIIAGIKVLLLEQTPSGRYAVHKECISWDENCIQNCQAEQDPVRPFSCKSCCELYDNLVDPLGKRVNKLAWRYTGIGGAIGITVGLIIAENKKRK